VGDEPRLLFLATSTEATQASWICWGEFKCAEAKILRRIGQYVRRLKRWVLGGVRERRYTIRFRQKASTVRPSKAALSMRNEPGSGVTTFAVNVSVPSPATETVAVPGSLKIGAPPVIFVGLPMTVSVTNASVNAVPSRLPEAIVVSVITMPSACTAGAPKTTNSAAKIVIHNVFLYM
jgi:hypothetical protein